MAVLCAQDGVYKSPFSERKESQAGNRTDVVGLPALPLSQTGSHTKLVYAVACKWNDLAAVSLV